jgi:hypothetical protein
MIDFVINLSDDVPLIAETLDKFPEGFTLLLYHVGLIPFDSWTRKSGPEVASEQPTQVRPRAY